MAATRTDQIMTELIGLGYTTGTINDRERKRLLAKTGSSGIGKTLDDLYILANEPNRLYGDRSAPLANGGGGGSSWLPSDIPNIAGWYDADDVASFVYSSGVLVSQWKDKSGANNHLTQATVGKQPSRNGTINSKTAVLFNGAHVLGSANISLPRPATLLLVARSTATGQKTVFIVGTGADGRIFRTASGTIDLYAGAFLSTQIQWGTTAAHSIAGIVADSPNAKISADSEAWVIGNAGNAPFGPNIILGAYDLTGVEAWVGEVCEAILVRAAISDSDTAEWFKYAKAKWGTIGANLVINDNGSGTLSTMDAVVTDDLNGNLATASTDVTDSGTGILTSA